MARTYVNTALSELHGRVGDIVVKKYKYGEVVSRVPRMGAVPPSEKQLARQDRWRAAAEYYRRVKADPALAACYAAAVKKTGYPLSAITNRDFNHPPVVRSILLRCYSGHPGDLIEVEATDDFFVAAVTVTLRDTSGAVLESGPATCAESYRPWQYHAQVQVGGPGPITIEAVAADLPGNRATLASSWHPPATAAIPAPFPVAAATPACRAASPDVDPRAD